MSELAEVLAYLLDRLEAGDCSPVFPVQGRTTADRLRHLPVSIALNRVLDTSEAAAFCGFSVPHWRRLYRSGRAPPPIRLSARKLGWRTGDLINWLQARQDSS